MYSSSRTFGHFGPVALLKDKLREESAKKKAYPPISARIRVFVENLREYCKKNRKCPIISLNLEILPVNIGK